MASRKLNIWGFVRSISVKWKEADCEEAWLAVGVVSSEFLSPVS